MRIVLDTNVFVSGVFFGGPPHAVLSAWRDGRVRLVLSPEILDEYQRVGAELARDYPGVELEPFLQLLAAEAEICAASPLQTPVCDDPDDDKFLACAVAAGATCIVSGDKHLRRVSGYQGIQVLTPRAFVDKHLKD